MPEPNQVIVNEWNASFFLIQTSFGLVVDALHLKAAKTTINPEPFELKLAKPATWEAFVEQAAVQMFVENQIPETIREIKVEILPGTIQVTARVKVIVEIEAVAKCSIRVNEGKQLLVEVETVSVGGAAVRNLVQQQLDKVNPILDAKDLPLNLTFDRVELRDGKITMFGFAEP